MAIFFDPAKNARNIAERGLDFALAARLERDFALAKEDTRKAHWKEGEQYEQYERHTGWRKNPLG